RRCFVKQSREVKWYVLAIAVLCMTSCSSAPIAPLSVAATGVTASFVLDKFDEKVTHIIGQAAAAASLVTSKAARDLQLQVQAIRQQLHDELDHNWDRLDSEKIDVLRQMDSALDRLDKNVERAGSMQDNFALDVDETLNRIPLLKKVQTL